jgi:hypothetical protein
MTAQQLIDWAGRLILELRADRSFGAVESTALLAELNALIAEASTAGWAVYEMTTQTVAMSGAASYNLPARPVQIVAVDTVNAAGVKLPAQVATAAEWAEIADESATGDFPELVFPDYAETCSVRPWPRPAGGSMRLYCMVPLDAIATLGTAITFPAGYESALAHNLAVRIAPAFGKQAPPDVAAAAAEARQALAARNAHLIPAVAA